MLGSCVLFLLAGHEAFSLFIRKKLLALARTPEEYRRPRGGEVSAKSAANEMLRYDSPQQIAFRHALVDVEWQGALIRKGQTVGFRLDAANRDERVFPRAEVLELGRREGRHLAYGAGIHACAGSSLANLEAELVFEALTQRLPRLDMLRSERQESILVRGLTRLVLDTGTG